jgi:DNA-binding CsgD family transcriptional regulator
MYRHQGLTQLIGRIYDTTLDPSLWPDVLDRTARFVGGSAAVLISKNPTAKSVSLFHEAGADWNYLQLYYNRYIELDPITTGHYFAEIEQPIAVSDLIPYEQFLGTRFYKEWVRPQGLVDFVSAVLDKTATGVAMISIFRHERDGLADDATRRCMRMIVPHIRRAMMIGKAVDLDRMEARTFKETLDSLGSGFFLVDACGRILHANAAGHDILDTADFLRSSDGRLVAGDAEADKVFRETFTATRDLMGRDIALTLTAHDGGRYVAHILPIAVGQRRGPGTQQTAVAAIFVRKMSLEASLRPDVIARTYRLTPAELRVLLAIVEAGGVREVSENLGVAETTIKTHLSRLFEKTGAGRQADLVKLVAGFASPLAG